MTTAVAEATTPVLVPLTLSDRCDACGAAAVSQALILPDLPPLRFCGHHTHKHAETIASKAIATRDERDHAPVN